MKKPCIFVGHAFTVTKYGDGYIALPGQSNQKLLWSADGIHFEDVGPLTQKSTGVYNPADFESDSMEGHVDWFIDVMPIKPRMLFRADLVKE